MYLVFRNAKAGLKVSLLFLWCYVVGLFRRVFLDLRFLRARDYDREMEIRLLEMFFAKDLGKYCEDFENWMWREIYWFGSEFLRYVRQVFGGGGFFAYDVDRMLEKPYMCLLVK
jgi:hypothetical protein